MLEQACESNLLFSDQRNSRNSRDRLLEEQNAAYLDAMRADQERVCS